MVMVNISIQMEIITKDNGLKIKCKDKENLDIIMVCIKGNSNLITSMDREFSNGMMELFMMDIGKKEKETEKETLCPLQELNTRVIGNVIIGMVMDKITMPMETIMLDIGKTIKNQEEAY